MMFCKRPRALGQNVLEEALSAELLSQHDEANDRKGHSAQGLEASSKEEEVQGVPPARCLARTAWISLKLALSPGLNFKTLPQS